MDVGPQLRTERLLLRRWRSGDREPYAAINADPQVREYFPDILTRSLSDAQIDVFEQHFEQHGFGMWAVVLRAGDPGRGGGDSGGDDGDDGELIGFTGMDLATYDAHFTPAVEIGWRLARRHWGHGYATEAARAALAFGFEQLECVEIVACTAPANLRSRAVMERLGMSWDPREDFDHPDVAAGHPLRRHVLYRLSAAEWRRGGARPNRSSGRAPEP